MPPAALAELQTIWVIVATFQFSAKEAGQRGLKIGTRE
jgi:hypothetical protein